MIASDIEVEKQRFRDYYNDNLDLLESAKETYIAIVKSILLASEIPVSEIMGRVKDKEESIRKFSRKYQAKLEDENINYNIKDHITDLIGIRVISLYETDIDNIHTTLSCEFEVLDVTDKIRARENQEDSFGYKGLHLDLKLKDPRIQMLEYKRYVDLKFEIQIRTIVQDAWSVLDHKIKYKKSIPNNLKRRINTLAALFELADREFCSIKDDTKKFQEEEKEKSQEPSTTEQLNAFSFQSIIEQKFPQYSFHSDKVDGFVSQILEYDNDQILTPSTFKEIVDKWIDKVNQYKDHRGKNEGITHALNPYTVIRHILYLSDKDKYQRILFYDQRNQFENWLKKEDLESDKNY